MRRVDEAVEVRLGRVGEGVRGVGDAVAPEVAVGAAGAPGLVEGPSRFVWRDRSWRVLQVQARWVESGPWWDSPGVRAARGEGTEPPWQFGEGTEPPWQFGEGTEPPWQLDDWHEVTGGSTAGAPGEGAPQEGVGDLLCEQEVWRVEAVDGRRFGRGVYELAHATGDGRWVLRAVVD